MGYSFRDYTGDGSNATFSVPIPYINKSHIRVSVNGVDADHTWSGGSVVVTTTPPLGAAVRVYRVTPKSPIAVWSGGGPVTAKDLNTVSAQSIYALQETLDSMEERGTGPDPVVIKVDSFGDTGNGDYTADTAAANAAIAACPLGGTVKFSGEKHYYLNALDTITKGIVIDGGNCKVTCKIADPLTGNGTPLFSFAGTLSPNLYTLNAVALGATSVTCTTPAEAANVTVGSYVRLRGTDVVTKWDGSGPASVSKWEMNQVKSVDAVTGVVGLVYPTGHAYTAVTLNPVTMVDRPIVRNFASIAEVYCGTPFVGTTQSGPTAPNIIDTFVCTNVVVENVQVDGWEVVAVCPSLSIGVTCTNIRGNMPFHPLNGGRAVVFKPQWCRDVSIRQARGYNVRHLVDWGQVFDGSSELCLAVTDDVAKQFSSCAFMTHGVLNRRIKSFRDTAINCNGWSAGNTTYAQDYDVDIVDFTFIGNLGGYCTGISVVSGAENVSIINPRVAADKWAVYIAYSAKNVTVRGGSVSNSGGSAIFASDFTGHYPTDVTVEDCDISSPTSNGIYADVLGKNTFDRNKISGASIVRALNAVNCDSFSFNDNHIILDAGGSGTGCLVGSDGTKAPTGYYSVCRNRVVGTTSGTVFYLNGTTKLIAVDNRAPGCSDVVSTATLSQGDIALGGGRVDNNNDAGDVNYDITNTSVAVPAGTSGGYYLRKDLLARWRVAVSSDTESGGNAGSLLQIQAFADDGSFIDSPITAARVAGGSVNLNRPQIVTGGSAITANAYLEIRSTSGFFKGVQFSTGVLGRWIIRSNTTVESGGNAGSDLEVVARDDAGNQIDIPVLIQRVAAGNIYLQRPTVIAGGSGQASALQIVMRTAAGQNRDVQFASGTVARWKVRVNSTAEGGSSAGSDLQIIACDDAGTQIDIPIAITRAAGGDVAVNRPIQMGDAKDIKFNTTTGTKIGTSTTQKIGFWNATPIAKPTVTGSKASGAALASLLSTLATMGLIVDSTTA